MPRFTLLPADTFDLSRRSWLENEQQLIDTCVHTRRDLALIFRGSDGIVVPRSYQGKPHFARACAELTAEGLPVHIRLTGGGVVPQSPDTVNLYLAYAVHSEQPLEASERHYRQLCALLQQLFAAFGINAQHQTVHGSFCDGRFNLAAGGRKIAGTAQCWQCRRNASNEHTALLSAVILAARAEQLTARANRLEAALGSVTRYQAEQTAAVSDFADVGVEEVAQALAALLAQ